MPLNDAGDDSCNADLEAHVDFLRIVLEVINAALSTNLVSNPELVYALLHRHEVFAPLRSHARFTDLLHNLYLVIDSFNSQVKLQHLTML